MMDKDLDRLLASDLLQVSEDFQQRGMQRIGSLTVPGNRSRGWEKLQWIALIGGGILRIAELAAFVFGIWAAAIAL